VDGGRGGFRFANLIRAAPVAAAAAAAAELMLQQLLLGFVQSSDSSKGVVSSLGG